MAPSPSIADGAGYEVTTLRRDVETDGRHAVVAFTDGLGGGRGAARLHHERALLRRRRRRSSIRSAATTISRAGRVRFIGERRGPHPRGLSAHPPLLPLLRLVRLRTAGCGGPERAAARLKAGMSTLSAERVWARAEAPPRRARSRRARSSGCARRRCCRRRCRKAGASTRSTAPPRRRAGVRLGARSAAPPGGDPAAAPVAHRGTGRRGSVCRGAERDRLLAWADAPEADPDTQRRRSPQASLPRRSGRHARPHRATPSRASHEAGKAAAAGHLRKQRDVVMAWQKPRFPVSGEDLVAAGHEPPARRWARASANWRRGGWRAGSRSSREELARCSLEVS